MSDKHTPGPWEVDDNNEGSVFVLMGSALKSRIRYQCHHRISICDDLPDGKQLAEAKANARLMAASPDLLEALKGLVELLPDPELDNDHVQREYVLVAMQAIAKATGGNGQ